MNAALLVDIVLVFVGGGCGALTRFGVEHLPWLDNDKYYYTVFINVTGCFIIGLLWAMFQHWNVPRAYYLLCLTGFLGGYTTYSAFTLDAMLLIQNGRVLEAIFYVAITFVGGLGGCALGLFVTEKILKSL